MRKEFSLLQIEFLIKYLLFSLLIIFFLTIKITFAAKEQVVNDLIYNGVGIEVSDDENKLEKNLGKPLDIKKSKIENKYSKLKDDVITYKFEGVDVIYYKCNDRNKTWLVQIDVYNDKIVLKYSIKIGMSEDEIISILGNSSRFKESEKKGIKTLYYHPILSLDDKRWPSEHEQLILQFIDGKLIKFSWSNWP